VQQSWTVLRVVKGVEKEVLAFRQDMKPKCVWKREKRMRKLMMMKTKFRLGEVPFDALAQNSSLLVGPVVVSSHFWRILRNSLICAHF